MFANLSPSWFSRPGSSVKVKKDAVISFRPSQPPFTIGTGSANVKMAEEERTIVKDWGWRDEYYLFLFLLIMLTQIIFWFVSCEIIHFLGPLSEKPFSKASSAPDIHMGFLSCYTCPNELSWRWLLGERCLQKWSYPSRIKSSTRIKFQIRVNEVRPVLVDNHNLIKGTLAKDLAEMMVNAGKVINQYELIDKYHTCD